MSALSRVALILLLAVVPLQSAGAIVGAATEGSPVAASLVMVLNHQGRNAGFCTGIVLAPTLVITAAHCVPAGADLRIHYPDAGTAPVMLPVTDVARHPGYRAQAIRTRERSIDLALIRLPATLPARFRPATLDDTAGTEAGTAFTISGYGVAREGDGASSGRLRQARIVARTPLSAVLLWVDDPAKLGSGACLGDSGGPVTRGDGAAVSAVTVWSAGRGSNACGSLTQALWISPHRAWIRKTALQWGEEVR